MPFCKAKAVDSLCNWVNSTVYEMKIMLQKKRATFDFQLWCQKCSMKLILQICLFSHCFLLEFFLLFIFVASELFSRPSPSEVLVFGVCHRHKFVIWTLTFVWANKHFTNQKLFLALDAVFLSLATIWSRSFSLSFSSSGLRGLLYIKFSLPRKSFSLSDHVSSENSWKHRVA